MVNLLQGDPPDVGRVVSGLQSPSHRFGPKVHQGKVPGGRVTGAHGFTDPGLPDRFRTSSPVSSRASLMAASRQVSPQRTFPPGTAHSPFPAPCPRLHDQQSSLPVSNHHPHACHGAALCLFPTGHVYPAFHGAGPGSKGDGRGRDVTSSRCRCWKGPMLSASPSWPRNKTRRGIRSV